MTKIGNMQKIMISLDIFAEEKSFLNWPENLPLKYQAVVSGHPVYIVRCEHVIHIISILYIFMIAWMMNLGNFCRIMKYFSPFLSDFSQTGSVEEAKEFQ